MSVESGGDRFWNLATVTALGGIIGFLYEKPGPYETTLTVPGIIGALLGYAIGTFLESKLRHNWWYWVALFVSALVALFLYLFYAEDLLQRHGLPGWYMFAVYASFITMNIAIFCLFALAGLRLTGKPPSEWILRGALSPSCNASFGRLAG